jgi:hypothetical protein
MKQCDDDAPAAPARAPGSDAARAKAGSRRGKLNDRLKEYVVERLAGFDSATAIVKSLREEFGVTVARQSIDQYHPLRRPRCAEKWKLLFFATRQAIIEGKAERGAANRMVRLRWRENMVLRAMEREDFALADRLLNSIASEVGEGKPDASEERPITEADRARVLAALLALARAEQAHAAANRGDAVNRRDADAAGRAPDAESAESSEDAP